MTSRTKVDKIGLSCMNREYGGYWKISTGVYARALCAKSVHINFYEPMIIIT
jgi:hypothetical protein